MKDEFYLSKIVQSASKIKQRISQNANIIEIGPGLGDLSAKLLEYFNLIAYEIDSELCSYLNNRFPKDKLELLNKDVLSMQFNNNGWLCEEDYILVSNLPYYIATRIIINSLKDIKCKGMVVMTQKEVAHKFCANTSDSSFCALSIIAQSLSDEIEVIANVPPSAFTPIPKVDSTIFSIFKNGASIDEEFLEFIKQSFCQPRKKLIKNLSNLESIDEILNNLNISSDARPHQVTATQYHQIYKQFKDKKWKTTKM